MIQLHDDQVTGTGDKIGVDGWIELLSGLEGMHPLLHGFVSVIATALALGVICGAICLWFYLLASRNTVPGLGLVLFAPTLLLYTSPAWTTEQVHRLVGGLAGVYLLAVLVWYLDRRIFDPPLLEFGERDEA